MISDFDDYPIHQAAVPVNQPSQSDRNFYDRYWFNGYDKDGGFIFEIGFGLYPNRSVMDGHFSVVVDGVQHCFHASRRDPRERTENEIGPMTIEIVRPMRVVRVRVGPNDTGIECDLTFSARSAPTQEPKNEMYDGGHLIMDTTRFTQFGVWEGHFSVGGVRTEVKATQTLGVRDRSWGVRPVGEPQGGAPGLLSTDPGVYWVWCTVHFDDVCTQFGTFEDRDGTSTQLSASILPKYSTVEEVPRGENPERQEMASVKHRIDWEKDTRRPQGAELEFVSAEGETYVTTLEPMLRFQMLAIGYQHPEWGHAIWKGEEVIGGESWKMDEIDPLDYKHIHVHTVCRARMGERVGTATLETICFGRHEPSGFKDFLDGAQ